MAVAVYSFINNPFQFLLDYGLNYSPYVFLIFCRRLLFYENQKYKYFIFIFLCMPLFGLLQLASSIVSGVLFFANYNSGYSSV